MSTARSVVPEVPLRCHCGQPLHYAEPRIFSLVQEQVDELGEFVIVSIDGCRSWLVPRHYIALHGLSVDDLPTLGFCEVTFLRRGLCNADT